MYSVKFMEDTETDLSLIESYYDNIDTRIFDKLLNAIGDCVQELPIMPLRHPKYPYYPEYRYVTVRKHYVFYKVNDKTQTIEIHRILHVARNIVTELRNYTKKTPYSDSEID